MIKNRKELESNLIEVIHNSKIKFNKKDVKDIKTHLLEKYDISSGRVQSFLNEPESIIEELDIRELLLLNEQVYQKTGDLSIKIDEFFTSNEIDEARQFSGLLEKKDEDFHFPITFSNATVIGNSAYMVTMDIQVIDKLIRSENLVYNYDLQREASYVKRRDSVMIRPTLNMSNVKQITEHLLEGTLVPTTLVFNASTRSAESGTELVFDPKKMELTITKGTKLDIVDGYHRCRASQSALRINPDLHFNFAVLITNYNIRKSQQYQAQLAKATPISSTRIMELEANRLSDTVVQQLKDESDLKGRISQTNRIHSINKELVTYNVLTNSIEEEFTMANRADAADVGDFLVEYFNILIGEYYEELNDLEKTRKESLVFENSMFVGYVTLANKMFENKIKARDIRKIIKNIDFSRNNKIWVELGILDEKGNITETNKARKAIRQYFDQLNIGIETK